MMALALAATAGSSLGCHGAEDTEVAEGDVTGAKSPFDVVTYELRLENIHSASANCTVDAYVYALDGSDRPLSLAKLGGTGPTLEGTFEALRYQTVGAVEIRLGCQPHEDLIVHLEPGIVKAEMGGNPVAVPLEPALATLSVAARGTRPQPAPIGKGNCRGTELAPLYVHLRSERPRTSITPDTFTDGESASQVIELGEGEDELVTELALESGEHERYRGELFFTYCPKTPIHSVPVSVRITERDAVFDDLFRSGEVAVEVNRPSLIRLESETSHAFFEAWTAILRPGS